MTPNSTYNRINTISYGSRRKGNTEYLLRAALRDPNVTIITRSGDDSRRMLRRYREIVRGLPWYVRLWRWIRRTPEPIFLSVHGFVSLSHGHRTPVVFDNGALEWN